jgi:1,4-dihydroxy-2-naphthoate octaprenyltransferase
MVPVVIGASLTRPRTYNVTNTLLCLIIALALQIGTNYANDYSDGVRGTDEARVGPFRLTASKLVPQFAVKRAAFLFFAVAAVAGLALSIRLTWVFIPLGMSAVAAGWFYTGGPKPYGYFGFGELFVMIYFGFVATVGTAFAQHGHIPAGAWWWGLTTGSMACALLEANNLRDVDGDQEAGKKTLAARLGRRRGSWLYAVFVAAAILGAGFGGEGLVGAVALAMYIPALQLAFSHKIGRELLPLLKQSSHAQWTVGAVTAIVMFVTR